jgi:hypothetical protein
MNKVWQFTVSGKAATGETWGYSGTIDCEFKEIFTLAMQNTFRALTNGRATYGQPGVGGCKGPYRVMSVLIEELVQ